MGFRLREGRPGKGIRITLTSIPSAGYSWQAEYDDSFLGLKSHTFRSVRPGVIGGKSRETYVFVPRKAGVTAVRLQYRRPWEKEILKEVHYRFTIRD